MTDTMMLRDCIRSRGVKLGHVSEAEKLSKMLGMTAEQRDRCFFGPAG